MSEWMPLVSGVMLGTLHARFALSRSTLVPSVLIAAAAATTLSGEWATAPYLVVADVFLVGAGVLAGRFAYRTWLFLRHRQRRLTQTSG